jgi:hypothetical protein
MKMSAPVRQEFGVDSGGERCDLHHPTTPSNVVLEAQGSRPTEGHISWTLPPHSLVHLFSKSPWDSLLCWYESSFTI